ncbi:MAG: hypothetical protein M1133_04795 [Armatimonadetes bacterium]|nr:hypothetical protein [Armatimonadota bacterium]
MAICLAGATCAGTMTLDLNGVKIGLDEQTGGVVSLSCERTGTVLKADSQSAGLLDVAYPVRSFAALRLATRFSKARVVKGNGEVTIIWDKLGPSRSNVPLPEGYVTAQVNLKASPDGRSVIMSCRMENKSQASVVQTMFPDLWGLRAFAGERQTSLYVARRSLRPFLGDVKDPLRTPFYPSIGASAYSAPPADPRALRKVELAGADGGMTISCGIDAELPDRLFVYRKEASPDQARLMWEHQESIEPGQTWESGEYWLTLYSGDRTNGLPHVRKLTTNGLEISIDEETGNIVRMAHPAAGSILADPDQAGELVAVSSSAKRDDAMLSSRDCKPRIEQSGSTMKIVWDDLKSTDSKSVSSDLKLTATPEGGAKATSDKGESGDNTRGKVSAEVTIFPAPDGRSTVMSCTVRNGLNVPIELAHFPDLTGLRPIEGRDNTRLTLPRVTFQPFASNFSQQQGTFTHNEGGWKVIPPGGYYQAMSLRWLDLGGFKSGISVFQKKWRNWATDNTEPPTVLARIGGSSSDEQRILWEHDVQIKPGETWTSGEFWFIPHEGGWAKGIEVFRKYVKQVAPKRQLPSHVRDGLGFQTIWMIPHPVENDSEKAAFKYKDIPAIARDARAHGLDELVPWFWSRDFELPIPTIDALGTRDDFAAGVREARRLGVNVAAFISIRAVRDRLAPRYGAPKATESWTFHPDLIPMFHAYYTDRLNLMEGTRPTLDNKVWLQDVNDALSEWIGRGVASFCWDLWAQSPELERCISKVRDLARSKYPESTFSGESLADGGLETEVLTDYTWNWIDEPNSDPILSVLKAPRLNCNVEGPMAAKMAFMCGNYLNVFPRKPDAVNGTSLISEIPELSKAIKECASLRKQFLDYFVNGYLIGDSVLLEPTDAFVRAHVLRDKMLVFVLNDQDKPHGVQVKSNLGLWLPKSDNYQVSYYDSTGKALETTTAHGPAWSGATRNLEPGEIAVFEIQAK